MRVLIIILLTSFISACAGYRATLLPGDENFEPNEGVIYFEVAVSDKRGEYYRPQQTIVNHLNSGKKIAIDRYRFFKGISSYGAELYLGKLPHGKYRFDSFITRLCNSYGIPGYIGGSSCEVTTITPDSDFTSFHVGSNRITNLGLIMIHIVREKTGREKVVITHDAAPDNQNLVRVLKNEHAGVSSMLNNELWGWGQHQPQLAWTALHNRAIHEWDNPQCYTSLPNGNALFAGVFGNIRLWNANGNRISNLSKPGRFTIFALDTLSDGTLVAGGEGSRLFYSKGMNNEWKELSHHLPWGIIEGIYVDSDDEIYITITVGNKQLYVYRGYLNGEWTEVVHREMVREGMTVDMYPAKSYSSGNKLYISKDEVSEAILIDMGTENIKILNLPTEGWSYSYMSVDNGVLHTSGYRDAYYSEDNGETWKESSWIESTKAAYGWPLKIVPVFRNARFGIAAYKDVETNRYHFITTKDTGKTWQSIAAFEDAFIWGGFLENNNGMMIIQAGKGKMVSYDDGKTWEQMDKAYH